MGQDIHKLHFSDAELVEYQKRLREETKILKSWFDKKSFSSSELPKWVLRTR